MSWEGDPWGLCLSLAFGFFKKACTFFQGWTRNTARIWGWEGGRE